MKLFIATLVAFAIFNLANSAALDKSNKRLIKQSAEKPAQWLDQQEIWQLIQNGQTFVDITANPDVENNVQQEANTAAIPTELRFQQTVRNLINRIDESGIMDKVDMLSNGFYNRYYNSSSGEAAQYFWQNYVVPNAIANYTGNITGLEFNHEFRQNSLVVSLRGANPALASEVVVLGAHFDSTSRDGPDTRAPGADDNGAGSVVILETLRVFAESGLVPNRTVEFHWYAGEEAGLLGSQDIASYYKAEGINVVAMLNQDVIGYYTPGIDDIGLHTDNGNDQMIDFVKLLTHEYLDFGRRNMSCGYGCSDHASWTMNGFPAVMTTAVVSNPAHHRGNDTIDAVDPRQTKEFVKLCLGFLVEMGEPQYATATK